MPAAQLLPAFDELLLGYKDRSASVDPEHFRLVMSSNGIAAPTVMLGGREAGRWARKGDDVQVTPFEGAPAVGAELLEPAIEAVRAFYA